MMSFQRRPKTGLSQMFTSTPGSASGYGSAESIEFDCLAIDESVRETKLDSKAQTKKILKAIQRLDEVMKESAATSRGVITFSDQFRFFSKMVTLIKDSVSRTDTAFNILKTLVSDMSGLDRDQVKSIKAKLDTLFGPSTFSGAIRDTKYANLAESVKQQAKQIEIGITAIKITITALDKDLAKRFVY